MILMPVPESRGIRERFGRLFRGTLTFIAGAACFSQATVFSKMLGQAPWGINSIQVVFFRFVLGFVVVSLWMALRRQPLRAGKPSLVIARGIFNSLAVLFLFAAVNQTTVGNANILNLTYPAWIFLTAPFINKEKPSLKGGLFFLVTMAGAFMVAGGPGGPFSLFDSGFNSGDLMALASGFIAAFGISFLREARKHDSTWTVLWYLFLVGMVLLMVPAILVWKTPPDALAWLVISGAAACGIVGQFLLTQGYKYVSASEGSLLSASGVLTSAFLGWLWFGEKLHPWLLAGGLLVLVSIAALSFSIHHRKA